MIVIHPWLSCKNEHLIALAVKLGAKYNKKCDSTHLQAWQTGSEDQTTGRGSSYDVKQGRLLQH